MYIPDTIPDDRNPVKSEDEQYKDIWETMEEEKKIFQEEL